MHTSTSEGLLTVLGQIHPYTYKKRSCAAFFLNIICSISQKVPETPPSLVLLWTMNLNMIHGPHSCKTNIKYTLGGGQSSPSEQAKGLSRQRRLQYKHGALSFWNPTDSTKLSSNLHKHADPLKHSRTGWSSLFCAHLHSSSFVCSLHLRPYFLHWRFLVLEIQFRQDPYMVAYFPRLVISGLLSSQKTWPHPPRTSATMHTWCSSHTGRKASSGTPSSRQTQCLGSTRSRLETQFPHWAFSFLYLQPLV